MPPLSSTDSLIPKQIARKNPQILKKKKKKKPEVTLATD
jgi:hypothetical protein